MTAITFQQRSPSGTAELDCARLLIGTDGSLFVKTDGAPVPLSDEQITAVRGHFGTALDLALRAARALA